MENNASPVMTRREVCEFLKISDRTLRNWEALGIVKGLRYSGRIVRYARADIEFLGLNGRPELGIAKSPVAGKGEK